MTEDLREKVGKNQCNRIGGCLHNIGSDTCCCDTNTCDGLDKGTCHKCHSPDVYLSNGICFACFDNQRGNDGESK
jgi:hypothetical protein